MALCYYASQSSVIQKQSLSFQMHYSMLANLRPFYYPNLSCIYILALCSHYAIYYSALYLV